MCNYLLRKGLEYLSDQLGSPTGRKLFDETLMMAPSMGYRTALATRSRSTAHIAITPTF